MSGRTFYDPGLATGQFIDYMAVIRFFLSAFLLFTRFTVKEWFLLVYGIIARYTELYC